MLYQIPKNWHRMGLLPPLSDVLLVPTLGPKLQIPFAQSWNSPAAQSWNSPGAQSWNSLGAQSCNSLASPHQLALCVTMYMIWGISGIFWPEYGVKSASNQLPMSHSGTSDWPPNGLQMAPKWPQMAPNGPHYTLCVHSQSHCTWFGGFQATFGQKAG